MISVVIYFLDGTSAAHDNLDRFDSDNSGMLVSAVTEREDGLAVVTYPTATIKKIVTTVKN